jgi:branched-chain amino acid transport system permease protein
MYAVVLAFFLVTFFSLRRLVASPLGRSFIGIRENEMRMRAMGCPTQRYKLLSFIISGAIAGLAGSLYALFNTFISPDAVHWAMSGDVLLMVTLGGVGSLLGPVIGALAFLGLKYFISSTTQHWLLIVGSIFIICVLFFPRGIYGALEPLLRRMR